MDHFRKLIYISCCASFLHFHCGQEKEIFHCDHRNLRRVCTCMCIDAFGLILPWKVQELGLISGEAMSKPSTSTVCDTAGDRRAAGALPEIEVLRNISLWWSSIVPSSPADTLQIWAPHPLCFLNREAASLADSP